MSNLDRRLGRLEHLTRSPVPNLSERVDTFDYDGYERVFRELYADWDPDEFERAFKGLETEPGPPEREVTVSYTDVTAHILWQFDF